MKKLELKKISSSNQGLPREWVRQKPDVKIYLPALGNICPNMRVVSQLSGGTSTATFILSNSESLRVCQFGPPLIIDEEIDPFEEKDNPKKFENALERLQYLSDNGIAVPKILSYGEVSVAGNNRQYIIMDFVKGIRANVFIAQNPNRKQEVYCELGKILAKLSNIPYREKQGSANRYILDKVRHAGDYLAKKQILSSTEVDKLMNALSRNLSMLGDQPISYVHLDPFPTNFHITKSKHKLHITLMDVEALQGGHSLIEGLGRAVQWGIYDWAYISKTRNNTIDSVLQAFLEGYSKTSPSAIRFLRSDAELNWLLETSQLANLPQAIIHAMKKNNSLSKLDKEQFPDSNEWNRNTLLRLITK